MQVIDICYKFINFQPNIIDKDDYNKFCDEAKKILSNKKTWSSFLVKCNGKKFTSLPIKLIHCDGNHKCKGIRFSQNGITLINEPHVTIALVTDNYMTNTACPGLEKGKNVPLSCTKFNKNYEIFINKTNWDNGFKTALELDGHYSCIADICKPTTQFPKYYSCFLSNPELIVTLYREYVINHEMGHALGRGHFIPKLRETNKNEFMPIMAQQTKGLFNYKINTWPLPEENCIVAPYDYDAIKKYIIPL
jgi:hypothetical protein